MPWYDFDLNRNGIPDRKEPWLYRLGLSLVTWSIKNFAAPQTLAARHLEQAQTLADQALATWEASQPKAALAPNLADKLPPQP